MAILSIEKVITSHTNIRLFITNGCNEAETWPTTKTIIREFQTHINFCKEFVQDPLSSNTNQPSACKRKDQKTIMVLERVNHEEVITSQAPT
jgi:hypothetical protein